MKSLLTKSISELASTDDHLSLLIRVVGSHRALSQGPVDQENVQIHRGFSPTKVNEPDSVP